MHPFVENFLDRPMSQKIGVAAFSVLLVGFLSYQYVVGPAMDEVDDLTTKKNNFVSEITKQRKLARDLPQFQEQVKVLEAKLKIALQELPDEKDIPDLLKSVADLAKDSGLDVSLFHPEPEQQRDFFAEVPVTLNVEGSFHQVATFFDEVGHMPRIVNVRGINLKEPHNTEKGLLVKAECSVVTFRYLPESERNQMQQQESDKKKRRK